MQLSLFSNGLVDLDWMEGDDFQKIGQMFDQILIDYCNPETRIDWWYIYKNEVTNNRIFFFEIPTLLSCE